MPEEGRRCEIVRGASIQQGTFIKYAPIEIRDDENRLCVVEKAIVELDNGDVVTVNPSAIRFEPSL